MKTFKTLLSFAAILVVFSTGAFAQQDVNVSAEVLQDITLTKDSDVDFGYIQKTSSPVLDPNGTNTDVGEAGSSTSFGKITVSAANDAELSVSYTASTTLGDGGSQSMTFTADATGNSTDDAAGSTDIASGGSTVTANASGAFYIYIGGNLASLSNQAAGTYTDGASNGTGPISVTVNYN